jgi:hypothetical protein
MEPPSGTEQCHYSHRRYGGSVFSHVRVNLRLGKHDGHKFDSDQLEGMKSTCQQHCFSTLNHNLAYCYNDARVIKFVWTNLVTNRMKGGARSFQD